MQMHTRHGACTHMHACTPAAPQLASLHAHMGAEGRLQGHAWALQVTEGFHFRLCPSPVAAVKTWGAALHPEGGG